MLREAESKKWGERPEVKRQVDAAVRDVTTRIVSSAYLASVAQVPAAYPSEADVALAYDQAKATLVLPATYRVSQIFLATAPGLDAAALVKVQNEAKALAVQARQGDFAALATARSQDVRSASRGGDVGALPLAQLLPEMRETVSRLQPGQVSEPVQTDAGFHVVKLVDSAPSRTATLEEVAPRLRQALREQRQQELVRDYMNRLAPAASVSLDTAALDKLLQTSR